MDRAGVGGEGVRDIVRPDGPELLALVAAGVHAENDAVAAWGGDERADPVRECRHRLWFEKTTPGVVGQIDPPELRDAGDVIEVDQSRVGVPDGCVGRWDREIG